jgi:hypothetical protein
MNTIERKTPRPHIGAKLPHDVYAELVRVKETSGKSESELINEAIAAYLKIDRPPTVPDRVSRLESLVGDLQGEVGALLGKLQRLAR